MAIRLLVSDIDGTLVNHDKQLTDATVAAVGRLRAAGIGFTVISARPMSGMRALIDRLAIDLPAAAFNGGTVFRRDGTILSHDTIPATVARGVIALAAAACDGGAAVDTWVFADDVWYASDGDGPHTVSERVSSAQQPVTTPVPDAALDRADKITFVSDDAPVLAALAERCRAAFGDAATIMQSQTYYLDVTAPAANKGDGVAALARAAGIDLSQIAAVGDQANDVPMLSRVALPIAMGNAPDAVKAHARVVTASNNDDGVAHAIDTQLLPETA